MLGTIMVWSAASKLWSSSIVAGELLARTLDATTSVAGPSLPKDEWPSPEDASSPEPGSSTGAGSFAQFSFVGLRWLGVLSGESPGITLEPGEPGGE